ncbi:hypothetical protein DBR32_04405 [Taibaiella sp. KBW10]|uniref:NAD(P)/FAD-dependent oxidoreductase n=1 Tax=Taibaiella sp. KBW10 TaxID=2153357 RepID=UPI000F59086B|nr:NAD(P)/FAD-dependent oxidoreductase [Taibaiella sp. KBW10]RQO31217.1 hypothetical protein DBR32_04405 [Taibaiella sp. KBW10]
MPPKIAIISGAGPAGLTAAYELLSRTDIIPIIFEKTNDIGGISKTVNYKGNRIDIGGHRFFSKSDRVMKWWTSIMPLEALAADKFGSYAGKRKEHVSTCAPDKTDNIMLIRNRLSRIYFLKKFFNYPISLSVDTLKGLGLMRSFKIMASYLLSQISPRKDEKSLEDFFINRFGKELYHTFFKDYTEKVWGISCRMISAEWGAQRIKGLSITKAIMHALKKPRQESGLSQKEVETSLIEQFLYPKFGPGQMWETVADMVTQRGGRIVMNTEVTGIELDPATGNVCKVKVKLNQTGEETMHHCDYFFSTMPVQQLIDIVSPKAPNNILDIAKGLVYRDFLTVGLLLNKLTIKRDNQRPAGSDNTVKDNWIYIQEHDVKVGRLQIFNNWSPYMVADPNHVWVGMEYFCNKGDDIWEKDETSMKVLGIEELSQIGIIDKADVLDATVIKMEKAYPAYFGTYGDFDQVKIYTDQIANLFMVGRNGMHKYNNSDHSMLTAMVAVDNIVNGINTKQNIWEINTEQEYHEQKGEK